jgi:hypothetical protein
VRRRTSLVVCLLLAVGACGGGGSDDGASTTTAAPATTSTIALGSWKTPQEAANNLMLAWKNSDGDAMRRSATQDAVLAMFGRTYFPHSPRGCDNPDQLGSDCVFRLSGAGEVRLHAKSDPAAGWIIDKVTFLD